MKNSQKICGDCNVYIKQFETVVARIQAFLSEIPSGPIFDFLRRCIENLLPDLKILLKALKKNPDISPLVCIALIGLVNDLRITLATVPDLSNITIDAIGLMSNITVFITNKLYKIYSIINLEPKLKCKIDYSQHCNHDFVATLEKQLNNLSKFTPKISNISSSSNIHADVFDNLLDEEQKLLCVLSSFMNFTSADISLLNEYILLNDSLIFILNNQFQRNSLLILQIIRNIDGVIGRILELILGERI